jgi:hypothetical protein
MLLLSVSFCSILDRFEPNLDCGKSVNIRCPVIISESSVLEDKNLMEIMSELPSNPFLVLEGI